MPNWMTTRCRVSGSPEQIRAFRAFALNGESGEKNQSIDFHKIIPMPEIIRQELKRKRNPHAWPSLEVAFFILMLNGGERLPPEFFAEMARRPDKSSPLKIKREELILHKEEVLAFLDAINPETGISAKPLSDKVLVEAYRATIENELLGYDIKENIQWLKLQITQRAPGEYTDEQLEKFSLTELANICKTLPGISDAINGGILQLRILAETGYPSWYEWSVENWGVRWAPDLIIMLYESEQCLDFRFDTAWDFPEPIFRALGKKFPDMEIWCACIDEETMECGYGHFAKIYDDDEESFAFRGKDFVYHTNTAITNKETGEITGDFKTEEVYFVYSCVFDKNSPNCGENREDCGNKEPDKTLGDETPRYTP